MENENNKDIFLTGNEEFFTKVSEFKTKQEEINNFGNNDFKEIKDIQLNNYIFRKLSLKECKFEDCSIKYSHICEYSYLRHASFKNVDFTGTLFENVNLEKAKFEKCKLYYVKFENCIIDYKEIIKSKPNKPNLAINLLKSLYKNELQQGNEQNADEILLLLKQEEINLYKRYLGCRGEDSEKEEWEKPNYYEDEMKRRGLSRFKVRRLLIVSQLSKYIWGYGIKITNIFYAMLFLIILFSLFYSSLIPNEPPCYYLFLSAKCWILNNEYTNNLWTDLLMLFENFLGILSIALFTSAFYRKVEK